MKMKGVTIVLALLLALASAQGTFTYNSFNGDFSSGDAISSEISLSDIITVANYYGCKTWVDNLCT
jgi:hypothetical protein